MLTGHLASLGGPHYWVLVLLKAFGLSCPSHCHFTPFVSLSIPLHRSWWIPLSIPQVPRANDIIGDTKKTCLSRLPKS